MTMTDTTRAALGVLLLVVAAVVIVAAAQVRQDHQLGQCRRDLETAADPATVCVAP